MKHYESLLRIILVNLKLKATKKHQIDSNALILLFGNYVINLNHI